jgi:hypothetical protein
MNQTFMISTQPFYNPYDQSYQNILTVNLDPPGPLHKLIRGFRQTRISPYYHIDLEYGRSKCGFAIQSLKQNMINNIPYSRSNDLMGPDEIPELISFLLANGYQLETQITNMLNQSQVKSSYKKLNFAVTYYGDTPPSIVYNR